MDKKKYIVTGGTGFIGSALVKRLVSQGHYVRVLDNNYRGVETRLDTIKDKIDFVRGDIRDKEVVKNAFKGINSVCHLAYLNGTEFFYSKPELVLDIGVKGMVNVIDACIDNNIKELILASSSEVYQTPPTIPTDESVPLSIPDPLNPRYSYGGGKIISELMAINYGRKYFDRVLIFRPHNVYGPDMGTEHVIPQFALRMKQLCLQNPSVKEINFPIQGTGNETRSFIYIDDFIGGLMKIIENGKHLEIYHIGTQDEYKIKEIALEVGKYFNKQIIISHGKLAKGGTPNRCPDITKIKNLGFLPGVSLKDGIHQTVAWYVKYCDHEMAVN